MKPTDLDNIDSREDIAVDVVTSVINKAHDRLGVRQNLFQIANSRKYLANKTVVNLNGLKPPLAINGEKLIKECIEKHWRLQDVFQYHLKYLEITSDESSQYFYYEAIFSQPTVEYPIPQTTASVFFRVEDKQIYEPEFKPIPLMFFRLEGHHTNHDVRYVKLIPDWLLGIMAMKIKIFKRIEQIKLF